MALLLDENGLTIQTLDEIKAEIEQSFRDTFGDNVNVAPSSVFGQIIGIFAEREAKVQATLAANHSSFDPATAPGVHLDSRAGLTGSVRKTATPSTAAGSAKGTDSTVIPNGAVVRLLQTGSLWDVIGGPYTIGDTAAGEVDVTIQSQETGEIQALTTGPAGWEIVTTISGWDTFETTADADLGEPTETDAAFRRRREAELLSRGCDVDAIRANVLAVDGVTLVRVFENRGLITDGDGLPGKAFEVLVEGGDEDEIAQAIFDVRPPGAESHGTSFTVSIENDSGDFVAIKGTRPTEVATWLSIDVDTTGAEDVFPANGADLIAAAVLAFANDNHDVGDDVIPQFFVGTVYEAVGNKSLTDVTVKTSDTSFGAATEAVLAIASRSRADFDSVRIEVNVT